MSAVPRGALAFFLAAAAFLAAPLWLPQPSLEPPEDRPAAASRPAGETAAPPPAARDPDFLTPYFALDPSAPLEAAAARPAFDPADEFGGLPRTENVDLVAAWCASCHSLQIVMAQALPRERWDALLRLMVETHGMAEPDRDDRAAILDYLAAHFSPAG